MSSESVLRMQNVRLGKETAELERELAECREEIAQCTEATDALRWHSEELEAQLGAAETVMATQQEIHAEVVSKLQEQLAAAEARELVAQAVLRKLEWLIWDSCPICNYSQSLGHHDGCELGWTLEQSDHAALDAALEAHLREFVEHLDAFIPGLTEDYDARFDSDEDREQNLNRVAYAIQRRAWEDAERSLDNEWQEAKMMLDKLGCEVGPMKERIDAALDQARAAGVITGLKRAAVIMGEWQDEDGREGLAHIRQAIRNTEADS